MRPILLVFGILTNIRHIRLSQVRETYKERERREEAEDGSDGVDVYQRFVADDASSTVGTRCHRRSLDVPRVEVDQVGDQRLGQPRSFYQVKISLAVVTFKPDLYKPGLS